MSTIRSSTLRTLALRAALAGCGPAFAADGTVGRANCNGAGLNTVLASINGSGGGTVRFDCGTATIPFTA